MNGQFNGSACVGSRGQRAASSYHSSSAVWVTMLPMFVIFPLLPGGVHGNSTSSSSANSDSELYQQFLSAEHGMISGMPNLALAGIIIGALLIVLLIGCLIKRYKDKQNEVKDIPQEIDKYGTPNTKARAQEEVNQKKKGGDIFEEIEGEIEQFEAQKKKLALYLKFLNTRDGGNIARTNAKRMKAQMQQSSILE